RTRARAPPRPPPPFTAFSRPLPPRVPPPPQRPPQVPRRRQPPPPVLGVLHPPRVVPEVAQRLRHRPPRVRRRQLLPRRRPPDPPLPVPQLPDHFPDPALPAGAQPLDVLPPAPRLVGRHRPRRPVHVAHHVQEVHDRRDAREAALLPFPVVGRPVGHEGLALCPVKVPLFRLRRHHPPERLAARQARHARAQPLARRPRLLLGVAPGGRLPCLVL